MSSRVYLLGIPLDPVTQKQAVQRLLEFLQSKKQHHVMTPNSEMLVMATKNKAFSILLNSTSVNLPDSAGLLLGARMTKQVLPERVTGVDTVLQLCRELDASQPVFLLGAEEGIAAAAAANLQKQNPNIQIVGTYAGSPLPEDAYTIVEMINKAKPALLLVAYGAPAQDFWIYDYLSRMPSVKVAMGVGGTFDFLSGRVRRAPKIIQKLYLEWLWRLILQPSRIGRILQAVFVFPLLLLLFDNQEVK